MIRQRATPPDVVERPEVAVLIGFESSGKSALFRTLTHDDDATEANFGGSTVWCRSASAIAGGFAIVDTPGLRFDDDCAATALSLASLRGSDRVVLVARATEARVQLAELFARLSGLLSGRALSIVLTFEDRADAGLAAFASGLRERTAVPVATVNARAPSVWGTQRVLESIAQAKKPSRLSAAALPPLKARTAPVAPVERSAAAPWLALLAVLACYGLPTYAAYAVSSAVSARVVEPLLLTLTAALRPHLGDDSLLWSVVLGPYGLVPLGTYSFVWALPVVALLGLSVAVVDQVGLKDRMMLALDPWMRRVGLEGRDLAPLLAGYGCNAVAVVQTRACSAHSRQACVSAIALGASCSYQTGAALSLFGSMGQPGLAVPYLILLVGAGVWSPRRASKQRRLLLATRAFMQLPRLGAILGALRATVSQFMFQAMPIFLLICIVAAALDHFGVLTAAASAVEPLMTALGLPAAVSPAIVLSALRKDGMLTLNALVERGALSPMTLLATVFFASTITACSVTLLAIGRELGVKRAVSIAGKQALSAIVVTRAITWWVA